MSYDKLQLLAVYDVEAELAVDLRLHNTGFLRLQLKLTQAN